MLRPVFAVVAAVSLVSIATAVAQTPPAAPSSPPPAAAQVAPATDPGGTAPVASGKRAACRQDARSKQLKGQDRKDAVQLCLQQARTDCLKQAIDQKLVGDQRKDFVKSCVSG